MGYEGPAHTHTHVHNLRLVTHENVMMDDFSCLRITLKFMVDCSRWEFFLVFAQKFPSRFLAGRVLINGINGNVVVRGWRF